MLKKHLIFYQLTFALSERIARLKAVNRLSILTFGEWLGVFSNVKSYHASTARALLNLGDHILIVGGKRKKSYIINMISLQDFFIQTGIHLGCDIVQPLGKYFSGMGGGHNTSAGVNGKGNIEDT